MFTTKFEIESELKPTEVQQRLQDATVTVVRLIKRANIPAKDRRLYGKIKGNSARLYAEPFKQDPPLLYCTFKKSETGTVLKCKIVDGVYTIGICFALMIAGLAVMLAGYNSDWPILIFIFLGFFELVNLLMIGFYILTRGYNINKLRHRFEALVTDATHGRP